MKISRIYLWLVYLFFYVPIAVLIIYSFNNSQYSMVWHGFTWSWYQQLFTNSDLWISALHSLILGICAATTAVSIGTLASVCLHRYRFSGRNLLYLMVFILIILPDIVIGTSLLLLYSVVHLSLGFTSLLIAHITLCLPFVIFIIYSRLVTYDKNIFEAAIDLGASNRIIFTKIIVPLLLPGMLAAWLLSFTLSLDDVIISYFVAGPTFQILPLEIYSMVRLGVNPEINALTCILLIVTLILVLCSQLALRKK